MIEFYVGVFHFCINLSGLVNSCDQNGSLILRNKNMQSEFDPHTVQVSKLRFYSLGIVAENKLLSSKDVEVTPVEEMPIMDGELAPVAVDYKSKAVDKLGSSYETIVETTTTIKAKWLPLGAGNRITAPDVRRGELVVLYKFGDTDQYFWTTQNEDLRLRKLETVIYAFSATSNEGAEMNAQTFYFFEISTHKKLITLHTSKDNGEPFGYDIQLDTGNGKLVITDDVGNYVLLDSAQTQIVLRNVDETTFDMKGPNLDVTVPKTYTVKCMNYKLEAGSSVSIKSGTTSVESSSGTVITDSSSINITSSATSIT